MNRHLALTYPEMSSKFVGGGKAMRNPRTWLAVAVLSLLSLLVYRAAFGAYFMLDDFGMLAIARFIDNPLEPFLRQHIPGGLYYRPVGMLVWWTSERFFSNDPFAHYLINLVLHQCVAVAIWLSMLSNPAGRQKLGMPALTTPAVAAVSAHVPKDVEDVLTSRCAMCHAAEPVWTGLASPPKGVMLDTPEHIARNAELVRMQAVLTHAMPPNNITEMTPEERMVVANWLAKK